jgi:ATP adenylyltransferase
MERTWAPWRTEYIHAGPDVGCLFCSAPKKDPKEARILFSGPLSIVIINIYPYNSGHLMISPARHVAKLEDLTDDESGDIFRLLKLSTTSLTKAFNPDGFNVGMNLGRAAGAGIAEHMHVHVVPRWDGDTNFMPVLADTKVISEHIEETYTKLKPYFEQI